jgi:hypothetical protein
MQYNRRSVLLSSQSRFNNPCSVFEIILFVIKITYQDYKVYSIINIISHHCQKFSTKAFINVFLKRD